MENTELENEMPLYAVIGGAIAGSCAASVATKLIKQYIAEPVGLKEKVVTFIGVAAIGSAIGFVAEANASREIQAAGKLVKTVKDLFTSLKKNDEEEDSNEG